MSKRKCAVVDERLERAQRDLCVMQRALQHVVCDRPDVEETADVDGVTVRLSLYGADGADGGIVVMRSHVDGQPDSVTASYLDELDSEYRAACQRSLRWTPMLRAIERLCVARVRLDAARRSMLASAA